MIRRLVMSALLMFALSHGAAAEKRLPAAAPKPVVKPALTPRVLPAGVIKAKSAPTGLVDLGRLEKPGVTLRQKRFALVPGGTLRFATTESVVRGLGPIHTPKGAVVVRRTVLKPAKPGLAGGSAVVEYRFTLPVATKPGLYRVTSSGTFQGRADPAWAFSFELHVAMRRIGEPRPL